ncbi:MAG: amidohydrolase family protein [Proteobacteria bacterium]|nr:MAG: amidohydrolase family protein [Pseudomonadota bacterium]
MAITVFENAFLIDCTGAEPMDGATVVVEDSTIREIVAPGSRSPAFSDARRMDLGGRTLMPGLIDAHVHLCAVESNPAEQHRQIPPSLVAAKAVRRLEQTLLQGFTTVRDAGGADYGFREMVEQGVVEGPRVRVSGNHIYQTGGHGDKRRPAELCCAIQATDVGLVGAVADGCDEVRKVVREQLRRHADQVKLMCSGGAMSPGDALETSQFTREEIAVAVTEAAAANRYVMAHAYSGAAVRNAVAAGVRSIEHGNLMDEDAAGLIRDAGAYLVPTLVTYEAIARNSEKMGVSDFMLEKVDAAREKGLQSLEYACRAGVKIGLGSDLLGGMFRYQAHELELQGEVQAAMEVLLSATRVNAEIMRLNDRIGTVEPGKIADLLVVDGNPLEDLSLFQHPSKLCLIMKEGRAVKNLLQA